MPRKPKSQAEQNKPQILRSIRLDNGDVYGPGEEEEFLEALQARADAADEEHEAASEEGAGPRAAVLPTKFDHKDEIKRLTRSGAIVNFAGGDDDDDEEEDLTHDKRANRAIVRETAASHRRRRVGGSSDENPARERVQNRLKSRLDEDEEREAAKPPKRKASKETGSDTSAGDGEVEGDDGGGSGT